MKKTVSLRKVYDAVVSEDYSKYIYVCVRYRPDKYRLVYAALFAKEFEVAKQLYFAPYSKYAPQTTVQALRKINIYCYTNYLPGGICI